MRCYLEVIGTPTSETPGTVLMLAYDDKRYLIGNLFEGASRACLQRGLSVKKVNDVFLTGRTRWQNIGGTLGMVLGLADTKNAMASAMAEAEYMKNKRQEQRNGVQSTNKNANGNPSKEDAAHLRFHGAPNLNYAIATARRFVFRTGMPVRATEHDANEQMYPLKNISEPTWTDDKLEVWALPLSPQHQLPSGQLAPVNGKKRSHDDLDDEGPNANTQGSVTEKVVKEMFDSDWRMDRLVKRRLSEVQPPAAIFVKDPSTGHIERYRGPMPGNDPLPQDIEVLVRQPWPGAMTVSLSKTEPSPVAVSYIIRNHRQRGKFLPKKAQELEVLPRTKWGELTRGLTVQNIHGKDITPDMVLEPGKQGGGFAVIDLPSIDYVAELISRPEWKDEKVMDGIGAFVWLLGPGVVHDGKLRQFQRKFSYLKHIISSSDTSQDNFAIETAARSAWRHHRINPKIFPTLQSDSCHFNCPEKRDESDLYLSNTVPAVPGLVLSLEPNLTLEENKAVRPPDYSQLKQASIEDCQSVIDEYPQLSSEATQIDTTEWESQIPCSDAEIITLGTGSSHPSTHRNVSGTLIRVPGCGSYLLDCGEGTLGSLRRLYTKPQLDEVLADLKMIWISHLHADHHLGTTSVVRAWYTSVHADQPTSPSCPSTKPLAIISDAPMLHWLHEYSSVEDIGHSHLLSLATNPTKNALSPQHRTPTFLRDTSTTPSPLPTQSYLDKLSLSSLHTVFVNHCRGAQAISFTTVSGLKISYSGDCRPSAEFAAIGKGTHVLIHEATLEDDMRAEAVAKKHSTAGEALVVASKMEARAVVLTHFSQRYPRMPPLGVGTGKEDGPGGEGLEVVMEEGGGEGEGEGEQDRRLENEGETAPAAVPELQRRVRTRRGDVSTEDYEGLIDQGDINRLLESTGMKVVMAFDYMKLPVRLIPVLERQQPLFRALYDRLAEKGSEPTGEILEDAEGPTGKRQSKNGKEGKKEKQRKGER